MTKRRCENWLDTFLEWTVPRGEAKEHLILWSGLYALSSALRRRVKVPKELLGSWTIYPYLYIVVVAPPGKARKTTTVGYAEELLKQTPSVKLADDEFTQQSMMNDLSKSDDGSMSILAGELEDIIRPSGDMIYGFLTSIFDGKGKHSYKTISRKQEIATNPCINLLACTVPEYIAAMPVSVISGGWASRVIFLFEEGVRRRKFFYTDPAEKQYFLTQPDREKRLIEDLAYIATMLEGSFKIESRKTEKHIEDWYIATADNFPLDDYKTHGYFERKPAHVMKVAMLLHIAYSDQLIITKADFDRALEIVGNTEKTLPKVFRAVGMNPYASMTDRIVEYVNEKGRIPRKDLLVHFYHATPTIAMLSDIIGGLIAMEKIDYDEVDTKIYYKRVKK